MDSGRYEFQCQVSQLLEVTKQLPMPQFTYLSHGDSEASLKSVHEFRYASA